MKNFVSHKGIKSCLNKQEQSIVENAIQKYFNLEALQCSSLPDVILQFSSVLSTFRGCDYARE